MWNLLESLKIFLDSSSLDEIGRINSSRIAELVQLLIHKEYLVFNMQRERTVLHLNVERRDESLSHYSRRSLEIAELPPKLQCAIFTLYLSSTFL